MTFLIFIIMLLALILVHEFGHFIAAKISGIRVDEFGLGFPPRILGIRLEKRKDAKEQVGGQIKISAEQLPAPYGFIERETVTKRISGVETDKPKKKLKFFWGKNSEEIQNEERNQSKGTVYSINWIPFGGFVKIFGEDGDLRNAEASFAGKNRAIQAMVLAAGVVGNLLFAWFLISLGFMSGLPVSADSMSSNYIKDIKPTIISVVSGGPAYKAGLKPGDAIISMFSEGENIPNPSVEKIQSFISGRENIKVILKIRRGKDEISAAAVPTLNIIPDKAAIGISMDEIGRANLPIFKAFFEGGKMTIGLISATGDGLFRFLFGLFRGSSGFSEITGPVGIASLVGNAKALGFSYLISFAALISINLAIINLLPFPALDGGRMLFVTIESVIRRPLNQKFSRAANGLGFAILILLMAAVTWHDLARLL